MNIRCFYTKRKSAFKANYKKEVRFSEELDPGMMERKNFCSNTVSVARPKLLIARKLEKISVEKKIPQFFRQKNIHPQTYLLYGILILSLDLVRDPDTDLSTQKIPDLGAKPDPQHWI
jgi:hypothetical protein